MKKIFNKWIGQALAAGLKSLVDHQQSVKYKSTIIKTRLCARTHSNFLQGHIYRGLFYWPNHSKNSAVQLRRTLAFKRGI